MILSQEQETLSKNHLQAEVPRGCMEQWGLALCALLRVQAAQGTCSLPTPPCHPEMHSETVIRAFRRAGFLVPVHFKGNGVEQKSNQSKPNMLLSCEERVRAGGAAVPAPVRGDGPLPHSCILYYKMTAVVIAT